MWLEVLASNEDIVKKYYAQESFIGSPGWVQIKCELRLLSRFSFSLNPDWELAGLLPRQKTAQKANTSTEGYDKYNIKTLLEIIGVFQKQYAIILASFFV